MRKWVKRDWRFLSKKGLFLSGRREYSKSQEKRLEMWQNEFERQKRERKEEKEEMIMVKVMGKEVEVKRGTTGLEVAKLISPSLTKKATSVRVNDSLWDLNRPIYNNSSLQILSFDDNDIGFLFISFFLNPFFNLL